MVVSVLYEMHTPCNCFTLSLCDRNSCKNNSWRDDHVMTIDKDQDDGDHGVMPVTMMIMAPRRWRSKAQDGDSHIMSHILVACDVYLLYILFCLVRR